MKTVLLTFLLTLAFYQCVLAQNPLLAKLEKDNSDLRKEILQLKTDLKAIKQDTAFLNRKLELSTLYGKSPQFNVSCDNKNMKFSLLSCEGSRAGQSVQLKFLVSHNLADQNLQFGSYSYPGKAYDSMGEIYESDESTTTIGNQIHGKANIPTDVPVKIIVNFHNITPGNDIFKLVSFPFEIRNLDYTKQQKGRLEIKNLKIDWK